MMQLRSYQQECINSIYSYFQAKTGNPLCILPTATGKSLVIAEFIRLIFDYFPGQRVMVLTHVKELIEQNTEALLEQWPTAPLGIYSAGLGQREWMMPIVYGGIASVYKRIEMFGHRDLLLIDECHLLNPDNDTMYQKAITKLREINPHMKVIGFTATGFRMGQGLLIDTGLFTDVCFDIATVEGFARLIHEGYLSPPIPKATRVKLDVSSVGLVKGEFNQTELQSAVDKQDVTYAALSELCEEGRNRHAWLVFCSGIEHAEHCAEQLNAFGVATAAVHSKITPRERDDRIKAFRDGKLRCVTNNNVLTTGFNHKPIDLIGMLRPTMSASLWVQMVGRGTRPSPETGKENCLVLDFARNTLRLGPIDDPVIPRKKGEGNGEIPVKLCDACGAFNHIRARFCICCGMEFTFEEKVIRTASTQDLLSNGMPIVETYNIDRIMYNRHVGKKSGKASIKVSYLCGLHMFTEYVTFDHTGFPLHRAREWWRQRHQDEPPLSTDLALRAIMQCRTPRKVKVWMNKQPPQILNVEW